MLRVEHGVRHGTQGRMRVIFYAEPISFEETHRTKKKGDHDSNGAEWLSLTELMQIGRQHPGLRGPELVQWVTYLEKGGAIYPLSIISGDEAENPSVEHSGSIKLTK